MGTWIVASVLLLVVAAIICSIRRDKQQGKHTCGGNCAHCKGCH